MIITFTKKIAVQNHYEPEFFFNRVLTANGIHFHVSVLGRQHEFYHFTMVEKYGKWRIVNAPQPPDWIIGVETELDSAICHGMLS